MIRLRPSQQSTSALIVQAPDIATPAIKELARLTGATQIDAISGGDAQCFRLTPAGNQAAVAQYCIGAALDFGFVPPTQRLDRVGLLAMDMDSTLITIECIDELADLHGIKPQIAAITAATMRGEVDFAESLTRRVALLAGLDVAAMQRVYDDRVRLSPGAERLLRDMRRAGAATMLVSGGFTFFTDRLRQRLGLDYTLANTLEVDGGRLTGRLLGDVVDARAKADYAAAVLAQLGGGKDLLVAIGDGANDVPLLQSAAVSIAYRAKPMVRAQAIYALDHCGLDAALNLFVG